MKYKQTKKLPETFKIEVNPKQSKALQKALFKVGKAWLDGRKEVLYAKSLFLFINNNKITRRFSDGKPYFEKHKYTEIKFSDYFAPKQSKYDLLKRIEALEKNLNPTIEEPEQPETPKIDLDELVDFSKVNSNTRLFDLPVHIGRRERGEYQDMALYLDIFYDWKIVKDDHGIDCLIAKRRYLS